MTRHIGAETLARFRQGDLSPRRNARIRAHLGGCARCSDLNEDLAGVTTLLAGAQPPPIPAHLAARIQTALATGAAAPRAAQGHRASRGSSSASVPAAAPNLRYQHDRHEDSVTPITTSTDFTAANLRSQVSRELPRYGPAMTGSPSGGRSPAAGPARAGAGRRGRPHGPPAG